MKKIMVLLAAVSSRKSASFRAVVSSISLLILLVAFGCAGFPGMFVGDNVPKGVPKGYVKVYYLMSEGDMPPLTAVIVFSTDNMDAPSNVWGKEGGWINDCLIPKNLLTSDNERGCVIAKPPGIYKYGVQIGTRSRPDFYKILVQEGMVTPIKLRFRNVKESSDFRFQTGIRTTTVTFDCDLVVEKPTPYKEYKSKK